MSIGLLGATQAESRVEPTVDSAWKGLYKIGGVTAFGAVVCALIQVSIESIGITTIGPPPTTIDGWFTLLQNNRLLGLTELTMFQIPAFVLAIPMYLALYFALRRASQNMMLLATALSFLGTAVYFATNTVFSMLSLSDQYAAATTDAQRLSLLSAGQAVSAISVTSVDVGLSIVSVAGLIISAVMLRSRVFSRTSAYAGLLAAVSEFAYSVSLTTPAGIIMLEASGTFFVIWIFLTGRTLYRLGPH